LNWETNITLPNQALQVMETLSSHGFEAYAVGGVVRDALLGRDCSDADITTNALPDQVKSCFSRTVDTGIAHGTVTVLDFDAPVEVTTYRTETAYSDHRRPDGVQFATSLEQDLTRRDFTINALAYSPKDGLIDLHGGKEDLRKRIIRAVGDPRKRFCEDALRMLRAVRFAARLGFTIAPATLQAMDENAPLISHVSAERIFAELDGLLLSEHPEHLCDSMPLLREILPELAICFQTPQNSKHHIHNVAKHILYATATIPPERVLRWTMLLHDLGKPNARTTDDSGRDHFYGHDEMGVKIAQQILTRLKAPNALIHEVCGLIRLHDIRIFPDRVCIKRILHILEKFSTFENLLAVQRADALAQAPALAKGKLEILDASYAVYQSILQSGEPYLTRHLAVNGNHLLAAGVLPEQIGRILDTLLERVTEHPEENEKEHLLTLIS